MFIILTYDIDNTTDEGKKRLRKIAKTCEKYGIRVQNSVFELELNYSDYILLKNKLNELITNNDSIRIYNLGNKTNNKIEILGKKEKIELLSNDTFIM